MVHSFHKAASASTTTSSLVVVVVVLVDFKMFIYSNEVLLILTTSLSAINVPT